MLTRLWRARVSHDPHDTHTGVVSLNSLRTMVISITKLFQRFTLRRTSSALLTPEMGADSVGRLDPAISLQLLEIGDEVSPAPPPAAAAPLHLKLLKPGELTAAEASEDEVTSGADSEGGILSDPEETAAQEDRYERRLAMLRRKYGPHDERTLTQVFKLLDCLIGQYKLNRTDELLADFAELCEARGGEWRIKHIQSSAFCRWKQYRFREALDLFLRQQELVGPSAALCENIGHTYSSLGDLSQAEAYFEQAVELLKRGSFGNRGGIYMGLGLVRERLGKVSEALPILLQSLEHYEREHTSNGHVADASIIAKAHMSVGKAQQKLNNPDEAARHMAEALRIFRKTCGEESPLTANAMGSLGKLQATRGPSRRRQALSLLRGALEREVRKDAFHLDTVWELTSKIKDVQLELESERHERETSKPAASRQTHLASLEAAFSSYLPSIRQACERITPDHAKNDPGTLAVFYKTAGELAMLAQDYQLGGSLVREAIRVFAMVEGFDCSSLVDGCHALLAIADANGRQNGNAAPISS
eukprot:scaffold81223_cov35-Tisochrysis_lutea.AAC.3